jgi:hypothetical protein
MIRSCDQARGVAVDAAAGGVTVEFAAIKSAAQMRGARTSRGHFVFGIMSIKPAISPAAILMVSVTHYTRTKIPPAHFYAQRVEY